MLVPERVADRAYPLAHPQRCRIAERRHRQPRLTVDLDERDVGVRIGAHDPGAEAAAVGQLDRDPFGAVDYVFVRQDAAVGVDDEAAAGAAMRRVAVGTRRTEVEGCIEQVRRIWRSGPSFSPALVPLRRRIDVDDGGVDPLDDVGKAHERRRRNGRVGDRPRIGHPRAPGDDRRARQSAGEDRADKKGDDCSERDSNERDAARHNPIASCQ